MVLVVVVIEFRRQEAAPRSVGSGFGFDLPRAAPLSATAGRASFGGPHALALLPLGPPSSAAARSPVARVLARAAARTTPRTAKPTVRHPCANGVVARPSTRRAQLCLGRRHL